MYSYKDAVKYISEIQNRGIVLGTDNEKRLLSKLGEPQKSVKIVHIAGTNGKGSIAAFISEILAECGYKTGLYRSPAVNSPLEIISVNGENISEEGYAECISEVVAADDGTVTSFEAETAAAFLWFGKCGCDVAVVETGMGGRDDATNAAGEKECAVFAHISMDHAAFLGNSVRLIAENKACIAEGAKAAVSACQSEEVRAVLEDKCERLGIPIVFADNSQIKNIAFDTFKQCFDYKNTENVQISLLGDFQRENAAVAIETAFVLKKAGFCVTDEAVRKGLYKAMNKGRFEIIRREPIFVVDGAHNEDAAERLIEGVKSFFPDKRYYFITGIFKDKEYKKIIEITAKEAEYIFAVQPKSPRALHKDVLREEISKLNKNTESCEIDDAVRKALQLAGENDGIVVSFGSLSFIMDVKKAASLV